MTAKRRKFSLEFKKKVVLDALKERETIDALAKKHDLQPSQISMWKAEALANFEQVFGNKKNNDKSPEVNIDNLYSQIGQQKVEIDFLKKKLL